MSDIANGDSTFSLKVSYNTGNQQAQLGKSTATSASVYQLDSDVAVLGWATRVADGSNFTSYRVDVADGTGNLNAGEALAFKDAVDQVFYSDKYGALGGDNYAARLKRMSNRATVKVHVAWDESDYQIDVGPAAAAYLNQTVAQKAAGWNVSLAPLPSEYIRILKR